MGSAPDVSVAVCSYLDWAMKSQRSSPLIKEPIMLKLAKHTVAIVVVFAAASAPVAAQAETPSFSYTHVVLTNSIQNDGHQSAVQPK